MATLDVKAYLENANSLRGNVYKIEGEVTNALAWSPSTGRLIAVRSITARYAACSGHHKL